MVASETSLCFGIRFRVLARELGSLLLVLCGLLLPALFVSLFSGEAIYWWLAVISGTAGISWSLRRIPGSSSLQRNEAFALAAIIFIIAPLLLIPPLLADGLSFEAAWFEAVSGFTTTGLTTLTNIEELPFAVHFVRAWSQWVGGLGFVVLSVLIFVGPGEDARRLTEIETDIESTPQGSFPEARMALCIYLVLSLVAFSLLLIPTQNFSEALFFTLSSVSTGGFSPYQDSLSMLSPWSISIVMLVSFLGALPIRLYRSLWMQGFKAVREAVQAKGLLIIQLVMIALFLLIMAIGDGVTSLSQIGQTTVMAVSAQTTTGFSLLDPVELSSGTLLVFILAMLIGGCIGSTAGGIKVFRLQVLLKLYQLTILRINQSSSAVTQDKLGHHHLSNALIQGTLCSVFLFLTTIIVSWLPFLLLDYDPLLSLFDIVSAVGTVGLSTGLTSTELPTFLKGVLMVDMTLGRLEIIPILVLFSKNAWFSKRRDNR